MEIDQDALEAFTAALVRTPSPSGREGDVAALVRAEMERLGYAVEVDALGTVTGTLDAGPGPCVLFDAHMDTVGVTDPSAWSADPAGELRDGRLYGRGTVDMKGPLAALVHGAAAAALRRGRVVVSASIAEEMIEGFATVAVARRVEPDAAVICEPSSPHPVLGPAILVPTDVASRPYPALSVLPDRCTVTFDRRTVPGEREEDVLAPLRAAVDAAVAPHGATGRVTIGVDRFDAYTGAPVEAPNFAPAWFTGEDAPVARTALEALGADAGHWLFCTNGSGTAALGIPTIGYGPGDETLAHRVDEHIELTALHAGARGYAALAAALT